MKLDAISQTIDVDRMRGSTVAMVGGANGLMADLTRCGLGKAVLLDFDRVEDRNIPRQDFYDDELGRRKVEALAERLLQINPTIEVETYVADYCALSQDQHQAILGDSDLIIYATDFFPAQARGNVETLRHGNSALWIGLYRGGRAGEIIHYVPGLTPACFQCICIDRYAAFRARNATITSDGGTILDLRLVDAVAGQVAVGILTRGAEGRMGQLIDSLGNRNLLQVKIDPEYRLGSKDIFAQYLGNNPANFSFTTIALPMERDERCAGCLDARLPLLEL